LEAVEAGAFPAVDVGLGAISWRYTGQKGQLDGGSLEKVAERLLPCENLYIQAREFVFVCLRARQVIRVFLLIGFVHG